MTADSVIETVAEYTVTVATEVELGAAVGPGRTQPEIC